MDDHVSVILAQWARERPDLEASPIGVVGRLSRLTRDVEARIEANQARFGLQGGRYDVLATLRRQGPPFVLNPTELQGQMMLSSGAMTHRIDLLEQEGLVTREPDPQDRRGVLVRLTDAGRERIDQAMPSHLETERLWLSVLSEPDQRALANLLRSLAKAHQV